MKNQALVFSSHGKADEVLSLEGRDLPEVVPDGCVRIKMMAAAVNPADLLFVEGLYNKEVGSSIVQGLPQVGGSEGAGVVVGVGAGVSSYSLDQHLYVGGNMPSTCTWQRFVDVRVAEGEGDQPRASLVPLPPAVSWPDAAQLFVNPCTCLGFLTEMKTGPAPVADNNDYVVLTGGNSALCRMLLQMAKLEAFPGKFICIVRVPNYPSTVLLASSIR